MILIYLFRLPQQLQRAMAAEAEATRDARAKVFILYVYFISSLVILLINANRGVNSVRVKGHMPLINSKELGVEREGSKNIKTSAPD